VKSGLEIILIFVGVLYSNTVAQNIVNSSSDNKPSWLNAPPTGIFFNYYSGMSSSKRSLDEAKELAVSDALSEIIIQNEIYVESNITTFEKETETELFSRITKEIKVKGKSEAIKGLQKEEEYWEVVKTGGGLIYHYYILMKIPKPQYANHIFSSSELKQTYGLTPIFKSVFIPGWGQIHKNETKKGVLILSGFAVTIASGIITQNISSSYEKDAKSADGKDWIKYYNDLSNQYYLVSMSAYVLASVIYGYNLLDVISSRGDKIYALKNDMNRKLAVTQSSRTILFSFHVNF